MNVAVNIQERIGRLEEKLFAGSSGSLPISGLSVAVIENFELQWAKGYGISDRDSGVNVTDKTLFQAASLSKPLTAVAVMRLVQQGILELDEDVNQYLSSWKVPPNDDWQPRISIRQLLSHTGGVNVPGFPGYKVNGDIPSLGQLLRGESPSLTSDVKVRLLPGVRHQYSGGGYLILQQLLEDVTGMTFSELMKQLVLEPLQMTDSSFEQPLSPSSHGRAASGHYMVGGEKVSGCWHIYPELAAAGLWSTPTDLAKFIIAIQKALIGKSDVFLKQSSVNEMLIPNRDPYTGLGFALGGQDKNYRFGQHGINEGFCSRFVGYSKLGFGAVVMVNTDQSLPIIQTVLSAIAEEYHWPNYYPGQKIAVEGAPSAFTDVVGEYELDGEYKLVIDSDGTSLLIGGQDQSKFELFPLSELSYFAKAVEIEIEFIKVEERVIGVLCSQDGVQQFGKKLR